MLRANDLSIGKTLREVEGTLRSTVPGNKHCTSTFEKYNFV